MVLKNKTKHKRKLSDVFCHRLQTVTERDSENKDPKDCDTQLDYSCQLLDVYWDFDQQSRSD